MEELGAWFEKIETITEKTRPPNISITNLSPKGDEFTLTGLGVGATPVPQAPQVIESGGGRDAAVLNFLIAATAKPPPEEENGQGPGEDGESENEG